MAKRIPRYVIRRADQLAALGSPVRWAIAESLSVHGASSVRELADRVNRPPEALYYHIRELVRVGLVLLDHQRPGKRRPEAVYRLAAPRLVVDRKQRSPAYLQALADSCATLLRLTERNYRAAVDRGEFVLAGPSRNLMVRRHTVRLSREGLAWLNESLSQLAKGLDERKHNAKDDAYGLTIVLTRLPDDPR